MACGEYFHTFGLSFGPGTMSAESFVRSASLGVLKTNSSYRSATTGFATWLAGASFGGYSRSWCIISTGRSFESWKKICTLISNSPHPCSVTSNGAVSIVRDGGCSVGCRWKVTFRM